VFHDVKIHPEHFEDVLAGRKRAELRLNDRDYKVDDHLTLMEWDEDRQYYTGRKTNKVILHILAGPYGGLEAGWVIISFV
jgi:hypothetical protein